MHAVDIHAHRRTPRVHIAAHAEAAEPTDVIWVQEWYVPSCCTAGEKI